MTAIMFETARLLSWLFGIVMCVSALVFFTQPKETFHTYSSKVLHWKVLVAALIPLLAFTVPILNGFNMWLAISPSHPIPASLSVHALLVLQVWIWSTVADEPNRLIKMTSAAYPAVLIMVFMHKAGL